MHGPTRRHFLRALAASTTVLAAGCAGDESPETPTATPSETATVTATPATTETPSGRLVDATPAEFRSISRAFVERLGQDAFQAAYDQFSGRVADQLTPDTLEQSWGQLTSQFGEYVAVESLSHATVQGTDVVYATIRFARQQQRFVLAFDDDGIVAFQLSQAGEWNPPAYASQSAFTEEALTLARPSDCSLGATLSLPTGDDSVPGVVLVHGSGPNDRDATVGPNKPLKDLAWGLASRGVAVLRYDKRTATCQVDPATLTIDEEVTDDALTAVDRLRQHDRVAAGDVLVVGHSLGATLAPRIAARDGNLAGVVMLAPLARSLAQAILDQSEYLAALDGEVTAAEREQLDRVRAEVQRIQSLDIPAGETVLYGGRPYWESLQAYDPVATARSLSIPRLILQGERDYQVTVADDLSQWRATLEGEPNVDIRTYERLNHLFMPGEGQSTQLEYYRSNHVAEAVVADVRAFVAAHT